MGSVKKYVFGRNKISTLPANTFIGGVASTIGTAQLLANKLAIDVSRISLFNVVGSDIQFRISGSYGIPNSAFYFNSTPCTYYIDSDYLVTSVGDSSFYAGNLNQDIDFRNCITVDVKAFSSSGKRILLKNAISVGNACFYGSGTMEIIYIPNVTTLGTDLGMQGGDYQRVFLLENTNFSKLKIYAHPSMATINGGGVEGDLANAISRGASVVYVTNFTAPNPITNLSAGTIYNTAIQLNFTAPSSTNAIEFYEYYVNGIFKNNITASGQYITGLTANTSYTITVIAVDIFYNKSVVSNLLMVSTMNNTYNEVNFSNYILASNLQNATDIDSSYSLIKGLEDNNLWNKIQAGYLFKGNNAANQMYNIKNPLNTNAAFRLVFSGGGTFSSLGYQCNGSNSFADTFFDYNGKNLATYGTTIVVGTNNNPNNVNRYESGFQIQSGSYISNLMGVKRGTANPFISAIGIGTSYVNFNANNDARGVFTGNRTSNSNLKSFLNGILNNTSNTVDNNTLVTASIKHYLGCFSASNSPAFFSNQRIQIAIIHEGLSDAEVATLHSIIDISETIAGRKTW